MVLNTVAEVLVAVVAALHLYFLILEMFLWQTPFGRKVFGMTKEAAAQTAVLARNQGLYNGLLALGLILTFFIGDAATQHMCRTYLLSCVVVAGIFGAITAKYTIFFVQALPAILALLALNKWV